MPHPYWLIFLKAKKLKPDSDESTDDFFEDELFNCSNDELVNDVLAQHAARQKDEGSCSSADVSISFGGSVSCDSDVIMDDVLSMKSEADEDEFTSSEAIEERKTKTLDVLVDALENVRKHDKEKIKVSLLTVN